MFAGRREENGELEYLEDLSLEERKEALRQTNDYLRKNEIARFEGGGKDAKVLVEQGYGPATAYEVDDDEFAGYNGKNGGKIWMWYEPQEF